MIFVAVGTQLAFDRLIEGVDSWEGCTGTTIIGQIGSGGEYRPRNFEYVEYLKASKFAQYCRDAEVIVAHAGTGVIFAAREYGVPLIIMPRRAEYKEHRNDHQVATAKYFSELNGIYIANSSYELHVLLSKKETLEAEATEGKASASLIEKVCAFIDEGAV